MSEEKENIAQTIRDIVAADGSVQVVGGHKHPFAVVPQNYKIEDLSKFRDTPLRIQTKAIAHDIPSLAEYWEKFAETGASMLTADLNSHAFKAIFDYHSDGVPRWRDHTIDFKPGFSDEWIVWKDANRKKLSQRAFGELIEDNLSDISEPDAAKMLDMVLHLSSTTNVKFESKVNLHNNAQTFHFSNDSESGEFALPREMILGIPIFKGCEAWKVKTRIRSKVTDSELFLWFEIEQPHKIIREAFESIVKEVETELATCTHKGVL